MRAGASSREEYVRFRLKQWGRWLGLNWDGTRDLAPKCLLGILMSREDGGGSGPINEEECEEVNQAYISLKAGHEKEADCLYMYYAVSLFPAAAAKRLEISEDTFYQRKKAGERFVSGALL